MSDRNPLRVLWFAIIAAVAPTISSLASLIVSIKTVVKIETVSDKVDATAVKVEEVHKQTNSMKDALIASTRKESLQEGEVKGRKTGRVEGRVEGRAVGKLEGNKEGEVKGHEAGVKEEKSRHFFK